MRQVPNFLTLTNLFCGCCALLYILHGQVDVAAWFTLGSFLCDYLDGMAARALGVHSPLGKQLDSLADVVSFGVAPGAMLYQMIAATQPLATEASVCLPALPAFVVSMFSALRLGKFNLDTRQTDYFIGLSTPACTIFVLGLALAVFKNRFGLSEILDNPYFFYVLTAGLSWLLVSEIPMFGMKIKRLDWRSNSLILIFLVLFAGFVFFVKELALSAIIVIYIVFSVVSKNKIVGAHRHSS